MTDGYSMNGSQANSVARNPDGNLRGGKRFSAWGPVGGFSALATANAATKRRHGNPGKKWRNVTATCCPNRNILFEARFFQFVGSVRRLRSRAALSPAPCLPVPYGDFPLGGSPVRVIGERVLDHRLQRRKRRAPHRLVL